MSKYLEFQLFYRNFIFIYLFRCQICGAKFSNRGTFWAHKKRHDNPKPYKCQTCEKSFTHSSHLAVHKRTHTGKKF